jgi:drug/metabolite transporter (DMT)-like permease
VKDHAIGLLITTLGVLFVVPDALFVRLITADPITTTFWRSLTSGALILLAVLVLQGAGRFRAVLRTGWPGALYIALMATTSPGFVLAVHHTSVANVVFIFASIPIFAALFSWLFLGEPVKQRVVWTMCAVLPGLGLIAYGSGGSEIASWQGDLIALYVSAAFAAALTLVRKLKASSMIPAIPIAYLGAALLMFPFATPAAAFALQYPLLLAHGSFIAIATCLLSLGPRYISSPEVSLLILLESVLAPLLVWLVIHEAPGPWALFGGALVIGAVFMSNLLALMRRS